MHSSQREKNIVLLSSIFIASYVTSNLIGSKLLLICNVTISAGVLVFPLTFLMTDLLSELYGKKIASHTVLVGLGIMLMVLFFVWIGGILPAAPRRDLTLPYQQMFSLTPRMVLASLVAYFVSQLTDIRLFHFWKRITAGKHLWLRNNASTMISQLIDTAIFITIFLAGVLPISELIKTCLAMYGIKFILAACDTPFMYLGKYILEEKD